MLTEEQVKLRVTGISGTDAAAICGVSTRKTPADVWLSKKHPAMVAPPDAKTLLRFRFGNLHEATVANYYAEITGNTIFKPEPRTFRHATIPWIIGSPDFLVKGKQLILEVKTTEMFNKKQWGPDGTDLIPQDYLVQVQHYMLLCDIEEVDVAVLIGLYEPRCFKIFRDSELQKMMLAREEEFWKRFCIGNEELKLDSGEQIKAYIKAKWPKDSGRVIKIDPYSEKEIKQTLLQLREVRTSVASGTRALEDMKAQLKQHMEDASEMLWEDEGIHITWKKNRDGAKVDWKSVAEAALALAKAEPEAKAELIKKHTNPVVGNRPFCFNEEDPA